MTPSYEGNIKAWFQDGTQELKLGLFDFARSPNYVISTDYRTKMVMENTII